MHEAGVAERILEAALARAAIAGAARITVVELEAGTAAGVSEEALRFHWSEQARGTIADGAELRIVGVDDPTAFRLVAIESADG
jgi:hydrogenase nickel incorporation protein HypA/HybF